MLKRISVYIQYALPHHLLTMMIGWLAQLRITWLKNWMIKRFIKKYRIDMSLAVIENPEEYPDFNAFFIRQLKPHLRPVANASHDIACPADGSIAQIGDIKKNQLLQAKNFYFGLEQLLGGDSDFTQRFYHGSFATFYLAPHNYHRVHMPLSGSLEKTIFVPGKLFSVNRMTSELVPNLYSQNERLITFFNTAAGPMAVILVGAMIVGNIQTIWMDHPIKSTKIQTRHFSGNIQLKTGDELGYFKLGSTVILLFSQNKVRWSPLFTVHSTVQFGQLLGNIRDRS
ncbi:MAG: phosphatidylserine decarboxylase [Gammaproteobacteria bacterium]|nr:phosphatidylserine decarboxylase [Gammaproteobacteria bacterium]MCW5583100.1 phosphatidylserine decarboxylase [Gammaproteobacteria bacterium]